MREPVPARTAVDDRDDHLPLFICWRRDVLHFFMMQFLYRLTPIRIEMVTVGATPDERAIVSEHFAHLEALTGRGVVLLVGRTQDNSPRTFGIVILQAESEEQAQAIMNRDPAVRKGIMRAELFPFRIALAGNIQCE